MAVVFPVFSVSGTREVLGRADVYVANYVPNGADPGGGGANLVYIGAIQDGVTQSGGPEYSMLDGPLDTVPAATDSVLTKDARSLKFTLRDITPLLLGIIDGGYGTITAPNTIGTLTNVGFASVPTNADQKAEGGLYGTGTPADLCVPYWQLIIRTPNSGSAGCPRYIGYRQFWKCTIRRAGDEVWKRTEHTTIPVEVNAHWDRTVTIAATNGVTGAAAGPFGRTHWVNS